jgi:uncharacterized membrane protein YphA (DoxX/SURF4 family)
MSGPRPKTDAPVRTQGALGHPEERRDVLGSTAPEHVALALGRVLFGGYFVYNGANHFMNHAMMTEYAKSKHVPAPQLAVPLSGALILLGGLSLLSGTRPKIGASLITAFLLGVTPTMHDFWKVADKQQRMQELVNFTKNLALIGGAALAAAIPEPWPQSAHRGSEALVAT